MLRTSVSRGVDFVIQVSKEKALADFKEFNGWQGQAKAKLRCGLEDPPGGCQ